MMHPLSLNKEWLEHNNKIILLDGVEYTIKVKSQKSSSLMHAAVEYILVHIKSTEDKINVLNGSEEFINRILALAKNTAPKGVVNKI